MLEAAVGAMPNVRDADSAWLDAPDAYYYSQGANQHPPVLRVGFGDVEQTWLYLDPRRGAIVLWEDRLTRVNRWLYPGLPAWISRSFTSSGRYGTWWSSS